MSFLLASIEILDTNAHTYRTDPLIKNSGIGIFDALYSRKPRPSTVAIPVDNEEDQDLTVTVIGNVDTTETLADYPIQTATIDASTSDILYLPVKGKYTFPTDFISIQLQYATKPTSGKVLAYIGFFE